MGSKYIFSNKVETSIDSNGLYSSNVFVEINSTNIISPTTIYCLLTIPSTDYTKKRESLFYYGKTE